MTALLLVLVTAFALVCVLGCARIAFEAIADQFRGSR